MARLAAGEYLKAAGIASPDGLAIQGESNGGFLVAVVVNLRPDLFAAALAGVGVMDMLRFDRFTGGALWVSEFDDPADEAAFRNLLGYSRYHNVRAGVTYPAILVTTASCPRTASSTSPHSRPLTSASARGWFASIRAPATAAARRWTRRSTRSPTCGRFPPAGRSCS